MSYTTSNAFFAQGITLAHSTTLGGTYTIFAEILDVTPAKTASKRVNVTNMQSVGAEEGKPSPLLTPGAYEFSANMTDADNVLARSLLGTLLFFKIVFNNPVTPGTGTGTSRVFKGWIAEVGEKVGNPDTVVTHTIKIEVTGVETVTAAT